PEAAGRDRGGSDHYLLPADVHSATHGDLREPLPGAHDRGRGNDGLPGDGLVAADFCGDHGPEWPRNIGAAAAIAAAAAGICRPGLSFGAVAVSDAFRHEPLHLRGFFEILDVLVRVLCAAAGV